MQRTDLFGLCIRALQFIDRVRASPCGRTVWRAADIGSVRIAGAANDEIFVRADLRFGSAVASVNRSGFVGGSNS